jgi:hypothetical protein
MLQVSIAIVLGFNQVQIQGIREPIQYYNARISKPIPDFMGCMDRGIVRLSSK